MKKQKLLFIFLLISLVNFSQNGNLLWQKNYGGSDNDLWSNLMQDSDSSIITVTWSNSNDYYINTNYGGYDILCLKIDQNGDTIFSKNYGTYADDSPAGIIKAVDTGYIIIANTNDTNKTKGGYDIWLIKINNNGDTIWTRTYGGTSDEFVNKIIRTNDNNYLLAISSKSNDGYFNNNQGDYDAWIMKIDANGDSLWTKHYAGSLEDKAVGISNTNDNGYIVSLRTKSNDGDFSVNYGSNDICIMKIDDMANTQWTKHIGGSDYDYIYSIIEFQNNYYLFGNTLSNDSDIVNNHGVWDILALKLDNTGNIVWQKCYGGTLNDVCRNAIEINNSFVIAGSSKSNDGDATNNKGEADVWIINIDTSGTILWQKNYGGTGNDEATQIIKTLGDNLMFCANTSSNNIDITNNFGTNDMWLAKISYTITTEQKNILDVKNEICLFPNPTTNLFVIKSVDKIERVQVFDITGKKVLETQKTKIDMKNYTKGIYFVKIRTKNNTSSLKLILK